MTEKYSKGIYEVVWPRGKKTVKVTHLAKRLDTLEGKTIGQLWDNVFRGDEIFPILEEELAKRYPGIKFINYELFGSIHGDEERKVLADLPGKLKRFGVDAVISGMAC